jgi:Ala-tRNA(Pro) deacylase
MPLAPDDLLTMLRDRGCRFTLHRHPPLFTVAESRELRGQLPGGHTKNLFLRDKRERMWLVTAEETRAVDLKALGSALGAQGRLSFGSPTRLAEYLGIEPGSVTPFALANDARGAVSFVLDRALLACEVLNFHPLTNEATVGIARDDFLSFMTEIGHAPRLLELPS